MDELQELLKNYLAAQMGQKPAEPAVAQKAETPAPAFSEEKLAELVAAAVAKAMPAPARAPEGEGTRSEPAQKASAPQDVLSVLVKKAAEPGEPDMATKRAIWALTEAGLRQGLREDPSDL